MLVQQPLALLWPGKQHCKGDSVQSADLLDCDVLLEVLLPRGINLETLSRTQQLEASFSNLYDILGSRGCHPDDYLACFPLYYPGHLCRNCLYEWLSWVGNQGTITDMLATMSYHRLSHYPSVWIHHSIRYAFAITNLGLFQPRIPNII